MNDGAVSGGAVSGGEGGQAGAVQGGQGAPQGGHAQGGQQPAWFSGLDGESQGWLQNKGYFGADLSKADLAKSIPELIKAHRGLESTVGRDKVVWPKDSADKAAWSEIHKRMGVPSKPEEYGLAPLGPDGKPNPQGDMTYANAMAQAFHEAGVPKEAALKLAAKNNELVQTLQKADDERFMRTASQDVEALKSEWGPQADANFASAQRAAQAFGISQEKMAKIERALGTKDMLGLLSQIGQAVSEDRVSAGSGQGSGLVSPQAAQAKLSELRNDQEWQKKYFSGDRTAVAEYDRLINILASQAA